MTRVRTGWVLNREISSIVGADGHGGVRKATSCRSLGYARVARTLRGRRPQARTETPRTGIGRSRTPTLELVTKVRAVNSQGYDGDVRVREVRQVHSTEEPLEQRQRCVAVGGESGGKEPDQGEGLQQNRSRTQRRRRLATCAADMRQGEPVSYWLVDTALCVITRGRSPVR